MHTLYLTHRILNGYAPQYLKPFLKLRSCSSERSSRAHPFALQAPLVGRNAPEKSFTVYAYRLWSSLDPKVCCNPNVGAYNNINYQRLLNRYGNLTEV